MNKQEAANKAQTQYVAKMDFDELMSTNPSFNDLLDYLIDIASYRNDITEPEALENLVKAEIKRQARYIPRWS